MAKRKIISLHEKKKNSFTLVKFFYWLALISFLGAATYTLFFSSYLSIGRINIIGTQELDRDLIENVVWDKLDGKYLGVINKNNWLFFREEKIKKMLSERFKKIENVDIEKKFPDSISVEIKERRSAIVFCGENCYIVDKKGIIYSERDYSLPEISEERLIILRDLNGKDVKIGENIFESNYLNFVLNISEKMKNILDIEMEKEYETPSRVSSDIRGRTKEGWKIYFNPMVELEKEIDMLRIVLDEKIGEKRKDLEYVDLRSENKVYYKFKEGTQEQQEVKPEEEKKTEGQPKVEKKKKK